MRLGALRSQLGLQSEPAASPQAWAAPRWRGPAACSGRPSAAPARPADVATCAAPSARADVVSASPPQAPTPPAAAELPAPLRAAIGRLVDVGDVKAQLRRLAELGASAPSLPPEQRTAATRVMGCAAGVWLAASVDERGRVVVQGWSDSELTRGMVALLAEGLSGVSAEEVLQLSVPAVQAALRGVLGAAGLSGGGRAGGAGSVLEAAKKRVRAAVAPGSLATFPSLRITAADLVPQGAFAEAQATYLRPDPATVSRLASQLAAKRMGVVAHFYMDPEVQGVLAAAAESWPHIAISDSLVMADTAVRMAAAGCGAVAVLGVDFMAENVRAILDEAGHTGVAVYRMAEADIGCSLAEAAEAEAYTAYLAEAAATPNSVHVVYINTSLRTKAAAHAVVPTITCTSSNVVQTVLSAFAQVPGATVWYGPDTYMGANLAQLFADLAAAASDDDVRRLHPQHTVQSIRSLLPRLRYFQSGTCIVHHIFGGAVCEAVRAAYGDAYLAAHFEVPGEMFRLAMEAQRTRGMGVVGSTSNILDFIKDKVRGALSSPRPEILQFVLGTEAGMVTSIVRAVQAMLQQSGRADVEVEIVFPVAPSAIATPRQATAGGAAPLTLPEGLAVVPGPASGEGCSLEGGCAACPYMKMNSLAALMGVVERVGTPGEATLARYVPRSYADLRIGGRSVASLGCEPILHMRHFQRHKALSEDLLAAIRAGGGAGAGGPAAAAAAGAAGA